MVFITKEKFEIFLKNNPQYQKYIVKNKFDDKWGKHEIVKKEDEYFVMFFDEYNEERILFQSKFKEDTYEYLYKIITEDIVEGGVQIKKFVPIKYIFTMIGLFFIMPIFIIVFLLFVIGVYELTVTFSCFFGGLMFFGPVAFINNQKNSSIVIKNNTITNHIFDGTSNYGWTEEINEITKIEIVNQEELRKYYKNCGAKKALLIHFGDHNIKYISIGQFSQKQINSILKELEPNKKIFQTL